MRVHMLKLKRAIHSWYHVTDLRYYTPVDNNRSNISLFEHTHPLPAADATILGEFHQKTSEPSNSPAGAQKRDILAPKGNIIN